MQPYASQPVTPPITPYGSQPMRQYMSQPVLPTASPSLDIATAKDVEELRRKADLQVSPA